MHSKRVLHRDIGTGNIFLSSESHVLLGDLGLSRALDDSDTTHAAVKTQMGTPPYMSPERVEGKENTTETCEQELYDFIHCVDHCVSCAKFYFRVV